MFQKLFHLFFSLFLALVVALAAIHPAAAGDEALDPTFGSDGKVTTDFHGADDFGRDAAIQPDGKIVVAGSSFNGTDDDFAVARYLPDGSLDETFGSGGRTTTNIEDLLNINTATASQLEALPGIGPTTAQQIVNYRSQHGPFPQIESLLQVPGIGPITFERIKFFITVGDNIAYAVALQPDGRIVLAGESSRNFALARYNSDGTLDPSFGSAGIVTTDFGTLNDYGFAVALQPDGRILVGGNSYLSLAMARYNSDGSLDAAFGSGGKVTLDFGSGENLGGTLALQPDGRIILAGETFVLNQGYVNALARFLPDGSLDTSFDGDGKVITNIAGSIDEDISSVVVQPDGRILAAGTSTPNDILDFSVARYLPGGSLDTSFDGDGIVITDFSGWDDAVSDLALAASGRIALAGYSFNGTDNDFALALYRPNGSLEAGFDDDGKLTTDFGLGDDRAAAATWQADGRILLAGSSFNGSDYDFALARYGTVIQLTVPMDIKPGNRSNPVNVRSMGKIPVAILSTPEFNAPLVVDRGSLTFDRTGDEHSLAFCASGKPDLNHDGLPDLLCHFQTRTTGLRLGDTQAVLNGQTLDGVPFTGQDAVQMLK
jgi:competence ComEA-like helix-hairpin-helix protein